MFTPWWRRFAPAVLATLFSWTLACTVARAQTCDPCVDAARSRDRYEVALTRAGRDLLVKAASAQGVRLAAMVGAACEWDSTAATPGWTCRAKDPAQLALWRGALERYAASGSAAGDSLGALGISVLAAIDRAEAHPVREAFPLRGQLIKAGDAVLLLFSDSTGAMCMKKLRVTGADSLASDMGADVWLRAECDGDAKVRVRGGHALGRQRMDLFVMGLCPFARRLETSLTEQLAAMPAAARPEIAVHYLLYRDARAPGGPRIGSLHGEKERIEDGVQIVLRDEHPDAFWKYLALRAASDDDWESLVQKAGMNWSFVLALRHRLERDLDAMLEREFLRTENDFARVDGSPTVYWRDAEVRDLGRVPGFTAPAKGGDEKCAH